ncbi:sensor histidine kinase [Natronosporangium hydrolyticum]|uniref:histidine kinase n=1 Tax=Natronosporangium hydrolyticum TaxID=2811111 RepID=A0A895YG56_9ACTN|nr:sensor histidine kinase [Natronosporangium hydrolyticum]QSB16551.1 sensor histidine kinase [Natronosporangium hydrolyticum]
MTISAHRGLRWRLQLTGLALGLAVLYGVGIALFVLTVVGLPLSLVAGVGIPLTLAALLLTRGFTDLYRWAFARLLGVAIGRPYLPWPRGHLGSQLWQLLRTPTTWRDLLWLLLNAVVGLLAPVLVLALAGGVLWYASLPLLWAILDRAAGPEMAEWVLRTDFGFWAIDSQQTAYAGLAIAGGFALLWWLLTPHLLRGYARFCGTLLGPTGAATLAARVRQLTESRAETVDAQAAELRRIERDLHDGAQARLVSLGMSIGLAEELIRTDPEAAIRLLSEAREDSGEALAELRQLVRGMHPPVLADRGLPGGVAALAITHPLPVTVVDELPGRPPAPVESAAYFAVSEALTNISKHAGATAVEVRLAYADGRLVVTVTDDGRGGAQLVSGGGLRGVERRLSAFDGTVSLTSPAGGPTVVTMEIPCELSSAKTTPSSGTG